VSELSGKLMLLLMVLALLCTGNNQSTHLSHHPLYTMVQ